ncbi:MAG: hypothetical protein SNJ82_04330 [Gemmataceae bacterium]
MYLRLLILATLIVPLATQAQNPYPAAYPAHKIGTVPGIRPENRAGGYNPLGLQLQQAKLGRMRIIELLGETKPAPALAVPGSEMGPVVVGGEPTTAFVAPPVKANPPIAETLFVRNWWNGRFIDDSKGRRWVLIHGAADWSKVDQVAGWILDSKSDVLHFLSDNGRLYRLQYRSEERKVEAPAPKK